MTEPVHSVLSWGALVIVAAGLYLLTNGCGGEPNDVARPGGNPELLSEWQQLIVADDRLELAEGVVPYSLRSALFSDYAHKLRTIQLPPDADPATYHPDDVFSFPVGTVITKTFYYPVEAGGAPGGMRVLRSEPTPTDLAAPLDLTSVRMIETRVLVHRGDGWHALPYVWDEDQTDATLQRIGDLVPLTLADGAGESAFTYVVPDANQCANCHATNHTSGLIQPIGPKARHLNREVDLGAGSSSQLQQWVDLGVLDGVPSSGVPQAAVWDDDTAALDDRARAYLDINCAHCHNADGPADTSGLVLDATAEVGFDFGVCKSPIAAGSGTGGRLVGIAPGLPDESIFVYRMASTNPAEAMPEISRSLVHDAGVALISAWIESLSGSCG